MSKPIKYQPWDVVRLHDRTDRYRVYTYKGKTIFVGLNSNTVTDETRDEVTEIIDESASPAAVAGVHG